MSEFKEINIIAYRTTQGISRIQYKEYVIQTYGYYDGKPDLSLAHFIIDPYGEDVCEKMCLMDCIIFIDKLTK